MGVLETILIAVLAAENAALATYLLVIRRVNRAMSEFAEEVQQRRGPGMYISREEAAEVQKRRQQSSGGGSVPHTGAYL